jgi:hypothetical protein
VGVALRDHRLADLLHLLVGQVVQPEAPRVLGDRLQRRDDDLGALQLALRHRLLALFDRGRHRKPAHVEDAFGLGFELPDQGIAPLLRLRQRRAAGGADVLPVGVGPVVPVKAGPDRDHGQGEALAFGDPGQQDGRLQRRQAHLSVDSVHGIKRSLRSGGPACFPRLWLGPHAPSGTASSKDGAVSVSVNVVPHG